jgi:hypothetical protein
MYIDTTFPPPGHRLAQVMRVLADLEATDLAAIIEGGIAILDARAGDTDLEPEEDRCAAGDDHMIAGPIAQRADWERWGKAWDPGSEDDAESDRSPLQHHFDQSRPVVAQTGGEDVFNHVRVGQFHS